MQKPAPRPELCLVGLLADAAEAPERLSTLAAGAVTVVLEAAGAVPDRGRARAAVEQLQAHGIAVLIEGEPSVALALGADGVHLAAGEDIETRYREARRTLGAGRIVGADAGSSRHDAMTVAELGADYVAFGETSPAGEDEARAQAGLVAWWAEVFEVPVVAFDVTTADAAARLAEAGADFIAVRLPRALPQAETRALLDGIASALRAPAARTGARS